MSKLIWFALAYGLFALSACSGDAFNGQQAASTTALQSTTCAAGSVYTVQYGCLPQSTCPTGQALLNNQCVAVTTPTPTPTLTATPVPTPVATPLPTATPSGPVPTPTPPITTPASCPAGQIYSSQYGCIEQLTCPDGSGFYNGQCVVIEVVQQGYCQDWCPDGFTNTPYGCFPQVGGCPPCTGYADGICYWGVDAGGW
jgi:hypothetical protein